MRVCTGQNHVEGFNNYNENKINAEYLENKTWSYA